MLAKGLLAPRSEPTVPPARQGDGRTLLGGAALAAGTLAIYWGTFSVPLLLDDHLAIAGNPTIRSLWPPWLALSPRAADVVGGRPLLNFSYAVNYAVGGPEVFGYHAVNLGVHVLAAWVLFALVRRTLRCPLLAPRFGADATILALLVSALWAWHPVQTEAVTYLTQRAESLMGLCYLLTLYCFARGAAAVPPGRGRLWFTLSALSCLAGVGTKEVIVTAPLLAFLYDRTFVSGSFRAAWRRHWRPYAALAATWIPLGILMGSLSQRGVGFGHGPAWWAYGLVECRVVVKYLLLSLWPHPLIFDYRHYVAASLSEVWLYALALAALLGASAAALWRSPAIGFVCSWFFVILAPVSSIVPVAAEPMAESRLYLPLAAVAAGAVLGAYAWLGRRSLPAFALVAGALGCAAAVRNQDYRSELSIWSDTVAKAPDNARAHLTLGNLWARVPGRANNALAEFQAALRLEPDSAQAHTGLGNLLAAAPGRLNEAIAEYRSALRLDPSLAEAHNNLGIALALVPGRTNEALAEYRAALRLNPNYPDAHYNLGNLWSGLPGHVEDAIAEYQAALRLRPDYPEAHNNLASAWSELPGHAPDAIAEYQAALRLKPDFAEAHYNLGNAWLNQPGRVNDAIAEYEAAMRLRPEVAAIHFSLAIALLHAPGRTREAAAQLETVLRLEPGNEAARKILAQIRAPQP
jgi:tetratricopeptide (TPR) repeat protein